jgi:hypothetical protein
LSAARCCSGSSRPVLVVPRPAASMERFISRSASPVQKRC